MQATFCRQGDQWVVRHDRYYRSGERVEVRRKDGTVSVVVIDQILSQPRGVQKRGDYVYTIKT